MYLPSQCPLSQMNKLFLRGRPHQGVSNVTKGRRRRVLWETLLGETQRNTGLRGSGVSREQAWGGAWKPRRKNRRSEKKLVFTFQSLLSLPRLFCLFSLAYEKKLTCFKSRQFPFPEAFGLGGLGGLWKRHFPDFQLSPSLKKRDGKREDKRETVDGTETV